MSGDLSDIAEYIQKHNCSLLSKTASSVDPQQVAKSVTHNEHLVLIYPAGGKKTAVRPLVKERNLSTSTPRTSPTLKLRPCSPLAHACGRRAVSSAESHWTEKLCLTAEALGLHVTCTSTAKQQLKATLLYTSVLVIEQQQQYEG